MTTALLLLLSLLPPIDGADLVLGGGRVFTGVRERWFAEAIAVHGDKIIAVGSDAEIQALVKPGTEVIDLAGRAVVPGFVDAMHPIAHLLKHTYLDLSAATSWKEVRDSVAGHARDYQIDWLDGGPFDLTDLPEGKPPHRSLLDKIVADRPVALFGDDESLAWLNSAALKQLAIGRTTPDPPGGRIGRDPDGEPTGLLEGSAARLALRPEAKVPDDEVKAMFAEAKVRALRCGITGIHGWLSAQELGVVAPLYDWGEFPLRVSAWARVQGTPGQMIDAALKLERQCRTSPIEVRGLLLRLDGMLGGRTAALLAPYADAPDWRGFLAPAGETASFVKRLNEAGLSALLQASGDAAVRSALDAIEAVPQKKRRRNVLERVTLVAPADAKRLAVLDAVAVVLPAAITQDVERDGYLEKRLGKERAAQAYPLKSLLDAGVVVAFGSAFELTPLDPLQWIYGAVARQDRRGNPKAGFAAGERLSLEEAFRAASYGGAYAAGKEGERGTLEVGKLADLVVLARDPFGADPKELLANKVDLVVENGKIVHPEGEK